MCSLLCCSGNEGIWIEADTLTQLEVLEVEVLSHDDGEKLIESKSGKMGVGNGYASKFVVLRPESLVTRNGKKFKIKMKVDDGATSKTQLFWSSTAENLKTWYKMDAEISDGYATFETNKGKHCAVK